MQWSPWKRMNSIVKDPDSALQTIWRYQPTTFNKTKNINKYPTHRKVQKKKGRTINAQSSKNWWNKLPPLLALSLLLLLLMALPAWLSWERSGVQLPFLWVQKFRSLFCEVHLRKKTTNKPMFLKMSLTESVQLNVLTILTNRTGGGG